MQFNVKLSTCIAILAILLGGYWGFTYYHADQQPETEAVNSLGAEDGANSLDHKKTTAPPRNATSVSSETTAGQTALHGPKEQDTKMTLTLSPESVLITQNNSLNLPAFRLLEDSETFSSVVSKLAVDGSADTYQKKSAYSKLFFENDATYSGNARIERFECGSRICVGNATFKNIGDANQFMEKVIRSRELPIYTLQDMMLETDEGRVERRFVFSVDPSVRTMLAN